MTFPEIQENEYSYLPVDLCLYVLAVLIIIANSIGIFKMCQSYHRIKFENYVLLSGILESIMIILYKLFRRFLKLYLVLGKKNIKTHIYNTYFIVLVIVNVIFIFFSLGFCIYSMMNSEGIHDEYVPYSHSGFSCLVSIVLFLFSFQIHKMIVISLKDSSKVTIYVKEKQEDLLNEEEPNQFDDENCTLPLKGFEDQEIYFRTRKIQLYIVALANFGTDTMEFLLYSVKLFVMGEEYFNFSMKTYAETPSAFTVLVFEQLGLLLSSLFNYIAFYFIIRDMYEVKKKEKNKIEKTLLESEVQRQASIGNACIANFLDS